MKILICGFMGSGKTYFLNKLLKKSAESPLQFLDLDQEIAIFLNIPITKLGEWITQNGWQAFRKIEQEKLLGFLDSRYDSVIALGGGTLNDSLLQDIKKQNEIKMVFLNTPFDLCYERIIGDQNRPLVLLKKEELRQLYEERLPLYCRADLILDESERKEIEGIKSLVHTLSGAK